MTAKKKKPNPYPRAKCSVLHMGCGGKGKPNKVIDGGRLMEYVGISWIEIRKATSEDYFSYPVTD